jgi:hypothetical protein
MIVCNGTSRARKDFNEPHLILGGRPYLRLRLAMDRPFKPNEKAKITAGSITSLVIVEWILVIALALLAAW